MRSENVHTLPPREPQVPTAFVEQLATLARQMDHLYQKVSAIPAPKPSRVPEQMLAVLRVVAMVLAVRLLLLLALGGTFTLALMAMAWQTPIGLATTIAFALLTLPPLVWMEVRSRPTPPAPPQET